MRYKKLLEPLQIRSLTLKNRMVVSAMVTNFANEDGTATEKYTAYHEAKARGGWGLVFTEDYTVDRYVGGFKALPSLYSDDLIENHRQFTDRIHAAGGKVAAQIYHAGRETDSGIIGRRPVAPSAINDPTFTEIPSALTVPEIEHIVKQFGECAARVKKAGFDAVEIHGAHGYLICSFVSPFSNKRTDAYGGTITGRAKFALDVVKEVRRQVGEDFPIFYRMSSVEYVDGGLNIEETKVLACLLEEAGVDCIHCAQGVYTSNVCIIPPALSEKGLFADNAAEIKSVVNIPVIAVGRITDPEMAESILRSGKADLITMARASLADPELPKKAMEGREDEIIRCIGCRQGCAARNSIGLKVLCLVNPMTGMEDEYRFEPLEHHKKVLVAGGGVSGCTAAIAAARRGHSVVLCEQSGDLGGQWIQASIPVGKGDYGSLIRWQRDELKRLGVEVRLNTKVTAELAKSVAADAIIDATGSTPATPPIQGVQAGHVVFAADVLLGKMLPGKNVAVIGGGMVGLETAHHLAVQGHQVTIFEMLPEIGQDAEGGTRILLMRDVEKYHIDARTSVKVLEIGEKGIRYEQAGQQHELGDIDTVVLAAGMRKNPALAEELTGCRVVSVGDANEVKNGFDNIQEAFRVGYHI